MQNPHFLQLAPHVELIVDEFCCAGGMSEAIEMATGRHVDIAVNHNDWATSVHQVNHPLTQHFVKDVREVDPIVVTRGRPVGLLHMSPDCTDHSQAKGGQPRSNAIRALPWVAVRWAGTKHPRLMSTENVSQLQAWSPLIAKRDKATGRVVKIDGSVAAPGEQVPLHLQHLVPNPKRRGARFRTWVRLLRKHGYEVEWRELCAADYGVPTTRERLFVAARRDGLPITWPQPTHFKSPKPGQLKWRGAHECVDWSIPCRSIFNRKKPLVDATMRRIATGFVKEVVRKEPFLVPSEKWASRPAGTAQVTDLFAHHVQQAAGDVTVAAHLIQLRGNCDARDLREPLRTVSAGGTHHGVVEYTLVPETELTVAHEEGALRCAAFLMRYYGQGGQWSDLRDPMPTITTKARMALVTVWFHGSRRVVVDVGMRMLTPKEVFLANGFPADYIFDRGHDGRKLTNEKQFWMCGNSVPPPLGAAFIGALWGNEFVDQRLAA